MKLTFFGAHGAAQPAHGANTCFLLDGGEGSRLLVDAGGDPARHLRRAGVSPLDLDALMLTHRHTDHVYGLPSIVHNLKMARRSRMLSVIGNADVLGFAHGVLDAFGLLAAVPLDWRFVAAGESRRVGDLDVDFFDARHSVPCLGFVASGLGARAVYAADTGPNPGLAEAAGTAPVLIHEATDGAADEATLNADGHSSARQAGQAAAGLGARVLFLCGMRSLTPEADEALRREAAQAFAGTVLLPEIDRSYDLAGPDFR